MVKFSHVTNLVELLNKNEKKCKIKNKKYLKKRYYIYYYFCLKKPAILHVLHFKNSL